MASTVSAVIQATAPATEGQMAAQPQATSQAAIQTRFPPATIASVPSVPRPLSSRQNFTQTLVVNGLNSDGNILFASKPITQRTPLVDPSTDQVDFWLKKLLLYMIQDRLATPANLATLNHPNTVASMALQAFPRGYKLWENPHPDSNGKMRFDKYLYGHPSGQAFTSPAQFYPHLKWLIQGQPMNPQRPADPCPCKRTKCGE